MKQRARNLSREQDTSDFESSNFPVFLLSHMVLLSQSPEENQFLNACTLSIDPFIYCNKKDHPPLVFLK